MICVVLLFYKKLFLTGTRFDYDNEMCLKYLKSLTMETHEKWKSFYKVTSLKNVDCLKVEQDNIQELSSL